MVLHTELVIGTWMSNARTLRWGVVACLPALAAFAVARATRHSEGGTPKTGSERVVSHVPLAHELAAAAARGASKPTLTAQPRVLHLKFSDGTPSKEGPCASRPPPPFSCPPGEAGCRKKLGRAVEQLFSDVDLRVQLSPPAEPHLTIEVSSANGGWCDEKYETGYGGVAPIDCSQSGKWGRTGNVFSCGDVDRCAVRVAQEAAHLLGLDHTNDPTDVMYPRETDGRARFKNMDLATLEPRCGHARQNSYRALVARLGRRETP